MKTTAILEPSFGDINTTPMMQQFLTIKEAHKDCLLFYRMGDFYELFFQDALVAAEVLHIALTKRGKHQGEDIPMCGVPYHSSDSYLQKLIKHGFKVAICEQMEDPAEAKKRGYKAVVRREVIRIVTPGTLTEDSLLDARSSNYLAALTKANGELAIAWLDISTGIFSTCKTSPDTLHADLSRLGPKELLVNDKLLDDATLAPLLQQEYKTILTPHVASFFDSSRGENRLKEFYQVSLLESFGDFSRVEIGACGALIEYIALTQKGNMPRLDIPKHIEHHQFMVIDAATRNSLELTRTQSGEKKGSLLSIINKTVTSSGARLLGSFLASPLAYPSGINERLDMVEFFTQEQYLKDELRHVLKRIPDMERAASRLILKRGGPRDLGVIRDALNEVFMLTDILEHANTASMPKGVMQIRNNLNPHDTLRNLLNNALTEELTALTRNGGFIRDGYHPRIDELQHL